jgi:hypothetical protein
MEVATQSLGTRVALSSGDVFYVAASLDAVEGVVLKSQAMRGCMVRIGSRSVNGNQVAQLTFGVVPSIETAETLEEAA